MLCTFSTTCCSALRETVQVKSKFPEYNVLTVFHRLLLEIKSCFYIFAFQSTYDSCSVCTGIKLHRIQNTQNDRFYMQSKQEIFSLLRNAL